ncbi:MAG: DNA polymerase/3'-5' exonuclease PolX [Opitutales bacterium]
MNHALRALRFFGESFNFPAMDAREIVDVLERIAVLLELKGENSFKIRAYQTAARALETLESDLGELIEEGRLASVKGIGSALADKIETLYRSGKLDYFEELRASVPPGLLEMLEIPGLGGKKVKHLHDALGVASVEELETACKEGRVASLKGFGPKTQSNILNGIANRAAYARRHLWWNAREIAAPLVDGLRELPGVERAEVAGSLRRCLETVGDLDFIVAADAPDPVMEWFTTCESVAQVTEKGETKSSVRFEGGMQADLRVVPSEQFACALHHFTGSRDHNISMRRRALAQGYSLSEWGLVPQEVEHTGTPVTGLQTEDDLFAFLGLANIPPELREGGDEIERAEEGALPNLVEMTDIRGVFHNHTQASDGRGTIQTMAEAAASFGWEYIGLADHSKASVQANGLDDDRVLELAEQVRAFNTNGNNAVHVFCGIECDILPDGSLDLEASTLEALDYTVVSVHSSFSMTEKEMTARVIRALEHPATTMLGHPSGRLLLRREPYAIDLFKVIDAAIANRVVVEINAHPRRLDMDWRFWRKAAERGLMCAINPDAHDAEGLGYYEAGINIARKGWLEKESVLNTRGLDEVRRWFHGGRG